MFKPGDKVKFIGRFGIKSVNFTIGKTYEVRKYTSPSQGNRGNLEITLDDNGHTDNGWHEEFFELVTPELVGPSDVCMLGHTEIVQQFKPSNPDGCECGCWSTGGKHSTWCKLYELVY